jgi:hypothetical protein
MGLMIGKNTTFAIPRHTLLTARPIGLMGPAERSIAFQ